MSDPVSWRAAVDSETMLMMLFADGSPLGVILDVLEEQPDLRQKIIDVLEMRVQTAGVRDDECA